MTGRHTKWPPKSNRIRFVPHWVKAVWITAHLDRIETRNITSFQSGAFKPYPVSWRRTHSTHPSRPGSTYCRPRFQNLNIFKRELGWQTLLFALNWSPKVFLSALPGFANAYGYSGWDFILLWLGSMAWIWGKIWTEIGTGEWKGEAQTYFL